MNKGKMYLIVGGFALWGCVIAWSILKLISLFSC